MVFFQTLRGSDKPDDMNLDKFVSHVKDGEVEDVKIKDQDN